MEGNFRWDLLGKLPIKWRIATGFGILLCIMILAIVAALYQDKPVEIFGIIKVGASSEELRKQIDEKQAIINSMISPAVHDEVISRLNDAVDRLKGAEAQSARANRDIGNLRLQGAQSQSRLNQLSNELHETKAALDHTRRALHSATIENQKLSAQMVELKELQNNSGVDIGKKRIKALVQELARVELGSKFPAHPAGTIDLYNNILRSLKRDLPNDSYVQEAKELATDKVWGVLAPILANTSSQLRGYLETTYLK